MSITSGMEVTTHRSNWESHRVGIRTIAPHCQIFWNAHRVYIVTAETPRSRLNYSLQPERDRPDFRRSATPSLCLTQVGMIKR